MQRFIFRIGLPKCGTTYFGRVIMSGHSGVRFLGKPYDLDSPVREIVERTIGQKPWDADVCRGLFDEHIATLDGEKPIVISDARLSVPKDDYLETPGRLRQIFGPSKIVLTVRNPEDYVRSMYVQHLSTEKIATPIDDWLRENWQAGTNVAGYLAYDDIAERFATAMGPENVHVDTIETLRADAAVAARRLAAFMEIDGNELEALYGNKAKNQRVSRLQMALRGYPRIYRAARLAKQLLPGSISSVAGRALGHDKPYEPVLSESSLSLIEPFKGRFHTIAGAAVTAGHPEIT